MKCILDMICLEVQECIVSVVQSFCTICEVVNDMFDHRSRRHFAQVPCGDGGASSKEGSEQ